MNARALRQAALLPLLVLPCACRPPPAPPASATAPAAAFAPARAAPGVATGPRVTRLDLGNAVDRDQRVVVPVLRFAPGDTLYASASVEGTDAAAHRLGVRWTYLDDNQIVLEEGKSLVFHGPAVSTFQLRKPDGWPPGNYKVELLLDGIPVQTRLFAVAAAPAP